jgi:hypothetical protein
VGGLLSLEASENEVAIIAEQDTKGVAHASKDARGADLIDLIVESVALDLHVLTT